MYVSETDFERVVQTLSRLPDSGQARVLVGAGRFSPPIQFEVSGDSPEAAALRTPGGTDAEAVLDLVDVLTAAMVGATPGRFAEVRSDRFRWDEEDENEVEPPEVAVRKFELATQSFDLADLKRRSWIKTTSKTSIPFGIDWDVSVRHLDDDGKPPENRPVAFATLRLLAEAARQKP